MKKDFDLNFFAAELRSDLPQLDLHPPTRLSEADFLIDHFLYDSLRKKEIIVKTIFGGGTGRLQKTIFSCLKKHPLIEEIRLCAGYYLVAIKIP